MYEGPFKYFFGRWCWNTQYYYYYTNINKTLVLKLLEITMSIPTLHVQKNEQNPTYPHITDSLIIKSLPTYITHIHSKSHLWWTYKLERPTLYIGSHSLPKQWEAISLPNRVLASLPKQLKKRTNNHWIPWADLPLYLTTYGLLLLQWFH